MLKFPNFSNTISNNAPTNMSSNIARIALKWFKQKIRRNITSLALENYRQNVHCVTRKWAANSNSSSIYWLKDALIIADDWIITEVYCDHCLFSAILFLIVLPFTYMLLSRNVRQSSLFLNSINPKALVFPDSSCFLSNLKLNAVSSVWLTISSCMSLLLTSGGKPKRKT